MTQRISIQLAGFAFLALCALGCGPDREIVAPTALPSIEVSNLAGETVSLPALLGDKPLLMWFWAPW